MLLIRENEFAIEGYYFHTPSVLKLIGQRFLSSTAKHPQIFKFPSGTFSHSCQGCSTCWFLYPI